MLLLTEPKPWELTRVYRCATSRARLLSSNHIRIRKIPVYRRWHSPNLCARAARQVGSPAQRQRLQSPFDRNRRHVGRCEPNNCLIARTSALSIILCPGPTRLESQCRRPHVGLGHCKFARRHHSSHKSFPSSLQSISRHVAVSRRTLSSLQSQTSAALATTPSFATGRRAAWRPGISSVAGSDPGRNSMRETMQRSLVPPHIARSISPLATSAAHNQSRPIPSCIGWKAPRFARSFRSLD